MPFSSIVAGLIASLAFSLLTMIHLDAQGAYYDELHQAPAAFEYIGKHPKMFTVTFFDWPSFNTSYSGAIKSGIYGAFLKLHPRFTLYSWRALGIVFVVAALFVFYCVAGSSIRTSGCIVFGALFLTDIAVILMTRHDWGPVALALCFRLLFIAIWLSIELKKPTPFKYSCAGFITGFAIFEKLSSVVMLVPLLLLVVRTVNRRRVAAALLGFVLGLTPLIRANYHTYVRANNFFSLTNLSEVKPTVHARDIIDYAINYVSQGDGRWARSVVLGESTKTFFTVADGAVMFAMLFMIPLFMLVLPKDALMRMAAIMVLTFVVIAVWLFFFPRAVFVHHWVLGTPFQYCAVALTAVSLDKMVRSNIRGAAVCRTLFVAAIIALVVVRIPNVFQVESSLAAGGESPRFNPAFNRLMELASKQSSNAFFIAADWGTGTQIYCGANGDDDIVGEPFWNPDPVETALEMAHNTQRPILYVVRSGIGQAWTETSAHILAAIEKSSDWHEVQVDGGAGNFLPMEIHEFVR